jgi:ATP-binding cassette subfamily B protein
LLGWVQAAEGEVLVDGRPLDDQAVAGLRAETAWVDPAIQLWNRTLYDNVTFGAEGEVLDRAARAVADADLTEVLERLPGGMQAALGEGGARVSGGQGQRVRLGRALMRDRARLVLLDEPFRGLERERRQAMMAAARRRWATATLLFVSHDVSDTLGFDRVVVVDGGAIVEDGAPGALAADPTSRYHALVQADAGARAAVWSPARWRTVRVERGRLVTGGRP